MSDEAQVIDYRSITSVQSFQDLPTQNMFDSTETDAAQNPIDTFILNTNDINLLYLAYLNPKKGEMPSTLGTLVILGYMSAVESYFRTITRKIINLDEVARRKSEPLTVSFGAAVHHKTDLLPEALLENFSFAGKRGITDALKDALGITKLTPEVAIALDQYARICEIRHCCVHRFGRLGSRNAIKLGLDTHSGVLERPFSPSVDDLQSIADLLRTFVKAMNNFIFAELLDRSAGKGGKSAPAYSWAWTWKWQQDRPRFLRYYTLFASTLDSPPSPAARVAYESFEKSRPNRPAPVADVPLDKTGTGPAIAGVHADHQVRAATTDLVIEPTDEVAIVDDLNAAADAIPDK